MQRPLVNSFNMVSGFEERSTQQNPDETYSHIDEKCSGNEDEVFEREKNPHNVEMSDFERQFQFKTKLIWHNVVFILIFHAIALYVLLTFPYRQRKISMLWGFVVGQMNGLGVTGGVHRLWTHRSYKAKTPLRILLALLYASAGQNRIHDWVRDHRVHHKFTETDADPHNSKRGFWFSHVGWLMMKKHPEVYRQGRIVDMSDIEADPVVRFIDKHFGILKLLCCFIVPVLIPVYFLNQTWTATIICQLFVRYPISLNATWSVNSFAHFWGYRSYDKSIRPTENLGVSLLTTGEGWHNYHHVFPWDYKAAEFGHVILNPTTLWIQFFAKIGWAYDLKQASPELVKKIVAKKGDGSYHNAHHNFEVDESEASKT